MSSPVQQSARNISNLLAIDEEYASPAVVAQNCRQKNWAEEHRRAIENPEAFWGDYARKFWWSRSWDKVLDWDGVHHQWFAGAKTNVTINALDRHASSERRNRAAYIWLGEDGSERIVTYGQLHRMVCRFANGLKSLGVKKGDRIIIYMPLTVEGVVSMLACARIGAIHSVVYAGLGHTALRDRIEDAQAKVVIARDVGFRRGKTVALKAIVDEALDGLESVQKVVVFSRRAAEISGREIPNPGIAWEIVERYGVSKMFTAPTALRMFMRYGEKIPAQYDITSLRFIACAGEPLNPEAWRWAQTHLAGDGKWGYVADNWWQTELGGPAIGTPAALAMRPGKAGVSLPGTIADVVDDKGKPVAPGVGGRLVLKHPYPCMLRTVWRNPARYERDWQQIPGCYITGDVALKDKDGYITVLGRADDVLNVAGHRIGTAEVESALVSHPAVAEAAAMHSRSAER